MRIIVIGGGAAGLAAAIGAAGKGRQVTILEKAMKPGRKILASGNGRCNLMNTGAPRYFGGEKFACTVLKQRDGMVKGLFEKWGLRLYEEESGRVYPACSQASAVLDVLLAEAAGRGVTIRCGAEVKDIRPEGQGYRVYCGDGEAVYADKVILTCGGMAGLNLGHDGTPYGLYARLGHRVIAPKPALTGIETEKAAIKGLSGLRCNAILRLCVGNEVKDAAAGEALFTDYGISGVCAMQLSAAAGKEIHHAPVIKVDFSPMMGIAEREYTHYLPPFEKADAHKEEAEKLIRARMERLPRERLLTGLLPALLAKKVADVRPEKLAGMLTAYPLPVTGIRGFEHAQVTQGGLDTAQFDTETMESRLRAGLYAAGEVLNVDGDCGGFNLQFAFLSGYIAGQNAAKRME